MTVSIIIAVKALNDNLKQCLDYCSKLNYSDFEIIVFPDESFENNDPKIRVIPTGPITPPKKRDFALKEARGEILAFTDSDCRPFPNWLSAGVNTLRETKASVVGGEVEFCFSERRTGAEYVDAVINMRNEKSIRERGVGKTANLFVVRSVFERIGLFPNHLASGGDVYYTAKTTAAGYRIRYSPEARVKHPTRFLGALLRKEFRTGIGKTSIHLLGVHPGLHGTSGMRSGALSQINPLKLHTSLQSEGYNVSFLKFLRILIAFYAVLVAAFLGEVYGYSFYLQRGSENL